MKRDPVYLSLDSALQELHVAENELNRPAEDAVTFCACNFTRNALNGFLRTFLLKHSSTVTINLKSDELLTLCAAIDPQFKTINLSSFGCTHVNDHTACEKMYCLSVEKVNECFKTALAAKSLVMEKLHLHESDFE